MDRRDFAQFANTYRDPHSVCKMPGMYLSHYMPTVRGKIKFKGHELIQTKAVGPDKVVASTDCRLGGRVHPQIA